MLRLSLWFSLGAYLLSLGFPSCTDRLRKVKWSPFSHDRLHLAPASALLSLFFSSTPSFKEKIIITTRKIGQIRQDNRKYHENRQGPGQSEFATHPGQPRCEAGPFHKTHANRAALTLSYLSPRPRGRTPDSSKYAKRLRNRFRQREQNWKLPEWMSVTGHALVHRTLAKRFFGAGRAVRRRAGYVNARKFTD